MFVGALRKKNERNISKIYTNCTMLTWLDFDQLEPREGAKMC